MKQRREWTAGNAARLLENGEAYYERVFEAIAQAREEVRLETFILFEDKVGLALRDVLVAAAQRGVRVHVLIDGWGSPDLSAGYLASMLDAGVDLRVFEPVKRLLGKRINLFRRMHRKIVVIDRRIAFVGGINYSADHLADFGPEAKQDYAVEVQGPVVESIHALTRAALKPPRVAQRWLHWRQRRREAGADSLPPVAESAGEARALLAVRDNDAHPTSIERHYRLALRQARSRIWIANAYFFPGYRLLRDLRRAAKRGVDVRLILQGCPDMPIVKTCASLLYATLQRAGVRIFEYCERPLHGKVALVDDEWATVGSSNLDPTSLGLNLEANVFLLDREFNDTLAGRLQHLMECACTEAPAEAPLSAPRSAWAQVKSTVAFFAMRHFPTLLGRWPGSAPSVVRASLEGAPAAPVPQPASKPRAPVTAAAHP